MFLRILDTITCVCLRKAAPNRAESLIGLLRRADTISFCSRPDNLQRSASCCRTKGRWLGFRPNEILTEEESALLQIPVFRPRDCLAELIVTFMQERDQFLHRLFCITARRHCAVEFFRRLMYCLFKPSEIILLRRQVNKAPESGHLRTYISGDVRLTCTGKESDEFFNVFEYLARRLQVLSLCHFHEP